MLIQDPMSNVYWSKVQDLRLRGTRLPRYARNDFCFVFSCHRFPGSPILPFMQKALVNRVNLKYDLDGY